MKKIYRILYIINRSSVLIAGWAVFLMMLLIILDIAASQIFSSPLNGVIEGSQSLMVAAVFLSLSFNHFKKGNIEMTLVFNQFNKSQKKWALLINHAAQTIFVFLLTLASWHLAIHSTLILEYQSGYFSFPLYPTKIIMAIGLSLLLIQNLLDVFVLVNRLVKIRSKRESN